jgi:hypothetical protein
MNKLIGGMAALLLLAAGDSPAHAGSWCVFYDASTYNCGFHSWQQCYETARGGGGGFCRENFFKNDGASAPAGKKARKKQY